MLVDEWFLLEIKNDEKLAEKKKTAGNKNFQGFKKKKKSKKCHVFKQVFQNQMMRYNFSMM